MAKQNFAGNHLTNEVINILESKHKVDIYPHYRIAEKQKVDPDMPPKYTLKELPKAKDSFEIFGKMKIAEEFKESTCQASEFTYDEG